MLSGEGAEFLQRLLYVGGSPQGARPKAPIYHRGDSDSFSTQALPELEPWLVKFPARGEHAEVRAIEFIYADCLRRCGIQTPETRYFTLPNRHAAFASRRFDRQDGLQYLCRT